MIFIKLYFDLINLLVNFKLMIKFYYYYLLDQ